MCTVGTVRASQPLGGISWLRGLARPTYAGAHAKHAGADAQMYWEAGCSQGQHPNRTEPSTCTDTSLPGLQAEAGNPIKQDIKKGKLRFYPTTSTGTTACCPRPGRTLPTQTTPWAAWRWVLCLESRVHD